MVLEEDAVPSLAQGKDSLSFSASHLVRRVPLSICICSFKELQDTDKHIHRVLKYSLNDSYDCFALPLHLEDRLFAAKDICMDQGPIHILIYRHYFFRKPKPISIYHHHQIIARSLSLSLIYFLLWLSSSCFTKFY